MADNKTVDVIPYYRVSTKRQGDSGLGIEGQQAAVEAYVRQTGAKIKASYIEVESGKKTDRPQLTRALAHARRAKATLVVAKLDRLSRNAAFLLTLQDGNVPLTFCDYPQANELTIGIMAVVAQNEAKAISDRTKAALQAAKARGTLLGSARPGHWDGRGEMRLNALAKARIEAGKEKGRLAKEAYTDLVPTMAALKCEGFSLRDIAARLNADGQTTRRGKQWNPVQVARVLGRA